MGGNFKIPFKPMLKYTRRNTQEKSQVAYMQCYITWYHGKIPGHLKVPLIEKGHPDKNKLILKDYYFSIGSSECQTDLRP